MSNKQRLDFQNNDQVKEFSLKILKSESVDELKKILKDYELWDNRKYWRFYGDNPGNIGIINNYNHSNYFI